MTVDVNEWVDRQSLEEERDNRRHGNNEFDFIENRRPDPVGDFDE